MMSMSTQRIIRIEMGRLEGTRPRTAGRNARLGDHGRTVYVPIVRITTDDGASGFGFCHLSEERAKQFLGITLQQAFTSDGRAVTATYAGLEFPLLDLGGKRAGKPVYALLTPEQTEPLRVRCYDTSLYFDDLHIADDDAGASVIAQEAREGWERGHRAFKIKVGRGARHMSLGGGTRRDIAVIQAVREAVGPDASLMLDANNGWNLNLVKTVLSETADCHIYWLEEPFHEDNVLYHDLKEWLAHSGLSVLIADGEGDASPWLVDWAREGLIDLLQYDVFGYGFSRWLALGKQIADTDIRCGPHHYGAHLGNYVTGHLAPALPHFAFVEWDEVSTPGIDAPGYSVQEGMVTIPDSHGFGLMLDEAIFQQSVLATGFSLTA